MKTNERGIALPTVLASLVALTALGLAMTISSQGEIIVSGVQQRSMESFHAADGGLNYELGRDGDFANPANTAPFVVTAAMAGFGTTNPYKSTVSVTYLPPVRLPPPGLRVSALKVASFHFRINSASEVAANQTGTLPATTTALEMEASKLGPRPAS